MDKTIFEKIINREIPSYIVYEDDNFIAILDINPKQKGHTLLIPKDKKLNFLEENIDTQIEMIKIVNLLSKRIKNNLGASGIKILTNIGKSSGQVIFHTHIHIIPFYENKVEAINNDKTLKEIIK